MNQPATRTKKKRAYKSSLRRKQAEATRELILDAVETLLSDPEVADFTIADVARTAEVAPATVYRQFDGRQALFDAYGERAAGRFELPSTPDFDLDGLATLVPKLHAYYAANEALMGAVMASPALRQLLEPQQRQRRERLAAVVAERYPEWTPRAHAAAAASIQWVMSPMTWRWFRANEATADRTSEMVLGMVSALLERMDTNGPLDEPEGEDT